MQFALEEKGTVEILRMTGRLDLAGADAAERYFEQFLREHSMKNRRLVLVFHGVEYISSSGLRVLVAALKDIQRHGGEMVLCGMNVGVEEVFQFAGLDTIFKIFASEEEATRALAIA